MGRTSSIGAIVAVGVLALAGCTTADDTGVAGTSVASVDVTLDDYLISPSATTVDTGTVDFRVANSADQVHEFVVARTDLDAAELPTDDDGNVSEEGATDLAVVDEIEDIEAGATPSLEVGLEPGHYVLFCNLPGHYTLGMHSDFEVSAAE